MSTITTKDGAHIFYKDWGSGRAVVFSHGWPLNADAWDPQAYLVASNGYRAVVQDRRGHGRSSQTWKGNDMDTYTDDLAALMDELDLTDAVLVGHSTGAGEVVRYLARYGTSRVATVVLAITVHPHPNPVKPLPSGMGCALDGENSPQPSGTRTITLAEPLGNRVIVGSTGTPYEVTEH
jgi:non-heme chloroperoxidase